MRCLVTTRLPRAPALRPRPGRGIGLLAQDDGGQDRRRTRCRTTGDVFTRDDDPELVRDAIPFALKLYESLLESVPKHVPLLDRDLQRLHAVRATRSSRPTRTFSARRTTTKSKALRDRALKLYLRAKDYCLRAHRGALRHGHQPRSSSQDPAAGAREGKERRTCRCSTGRRRRGARRSRSASISRTSSIDLPTVRALAERALALDETWSNGALPRADDHARQPARGARRQRRRARASTSSARSNIQKGLSPGPYVALATGVSVPAQDRAEFETAAQGRARDRSGEGSRRIASSTLITQRRARALLAQIDDAVLEVTRLTARGGLTCQPSKTLAVSARGRRSRRLRLGAARRRHHQARHAGAGQLDVAQGAARHGRRVGREDDRPREADGLCRRHAGRRGKRRSG